MWDYLVGHTIDVLRAMEPESVQMVVTSPPYWGLRAYAGEQEAIWGGDPACVHDWTDAGGGLLHENRNFCEGTQEEVHGANPLVHIKKYDNVPSATCSKCGAWKGCFGLEPTPEMYVDHTILVLRAIRRVLRPDGVVFWNVGDSYAGSWGNAGNRPQTDGTPAHQRDRTSEYIPRKAWEDHRYVPPNQKVKGCKPKDLVMIPFRVALAVQADGWWVRDDIIWYKPNPMPSSVTDRTTKCHEYIFMFTKSGRYYWDQESVREKCAEYESERRLREESEGLVSQYELKVDGQDHAPSQSSGLRTNVKRAEYARAGRNIRSVWEITTQSCPGAHFAIFPERIPELCIRAGSSEKGRCPKCGAPWVRVVERDNPSISFFEKDHISESGAEGSLRSRQSNKSNHRNIGPDGKSKGMYSTAVTKGWQPSCKCHEAQEKPSDFPRFSNGWFINNEHAIPVPSVILDPFCGSGTTLKVARRLGRHAIGIDIANEYREIADKRAMLGTPDITRY